MQCLLELELQSASMCHNGSCFLASKLCVHLQPFNLSNTIYNKGFTFYSYIDGKIGKIVFVRLFLSYCILSSFTADE